MHKELEVMKPRCKGLWERCRVAVIVLYYRLFTSTPIRALAAEKGKSTATDTGVKEVTDGIGVIKELVLGCVGGVGVIFLAWGLLDFGTGYSAHDTTQQSQAIKKVIGGRSTGNFKAAWCFVRITGILKGGDAGGIVGFRNRIF